MAPDLISGAGHGTLPDTRHLGNRVSALLWAFKVSSQITKNLLWQPFIRGLKNRGEAVFLVSRPLFSQKIKVDKVGLGEMFNYDIKRMRMTLVDVIRQNVTEDVQAWLEEKGLAIQAGDISQLNTAFASVPRRTGKKIIRLTAEQKQQLQSIRSGFTIRDWTIDRLCRVWLLLELEPKDKDLYLNAVENLFLAAEMSELVALYSSLPVLAYPQDWRLRCAEGIRSNIGFVLESIMCNNPYPSENLDDPAWNQLVLKAIFTEKPVHLIAGLDQRANQELATILSDYAHERWAAHRYVNPQLWRCVGPFINERIFPDIERIANAENPIDRDAAALACAQSSYLPARELLRNNRHLQAILDDGTVTWDTIAEKALIYS